MLKFSEIKLAEEDNPQGKEEHWYHCYMKSLMKK